MGFFIRSSTFIFLQISFWVKTWVKSQIEERQKNVVHLYRKTRLLLERRFVCNVRTQ